MLAIVESMLTDQAIDIVLLLCRAGLSAVRSITT